MLKGLLPGWPWRGRGKGDTLALTLNELLTNSLKHQTGAGRVRITIDDSENGSTIRVINPGRLPPGFSFETDRSAQGGLKLIKALLPREGNRLSFRQSGDEVIAELTLTPPVLVRAARSMLH